MKAAVIIAAGGMGKRFDSKIPKQFLILKGKPVFLRSVQAFSSLKVFKTIIVCVPKNMLDSLSKKYKKLPKLKWVSAGKERFDTVKNGLKYIDADIDFIAVHDAARALINKKDILKVLKQAEISKAAVAVEKTKDTIKVVKNGKIIETLDRSVLWNAQTPQIFEKDILLKAYSSKIAPNTTDDSQLAQKLNIKPSAVETDFPNFKITSKTDFDLAKLILEKN